MIANMALDGLEAAVYASVGPTIRARRKFKINVVRYADDFVVTGISKEILEHKVLPAVRQFMAVRGLELSEEKTIRETLQRLRLFCAMTIPIVRHVKIQCLANPFDSAWEAYFTRRRAAKNSVRLFGATPWC